ncbi:hypothetical protein C8F04DRAFT_962425 [Mycena alexandri]|uniref:DUF6570 domain-containing protein n=1 Tax=Mycena alexandri TaxID=1745969 RepID=A0AAD6SNT3_9AGAR|nr:hypothetical protein C8F04DRAFT_962425 [Mycena alexandri]
MRGSESAPVFPPKPPSEKLLCTIAHNFCRDMNPTAFEEAGCAVCGQSAILEELTPLRDLTFPLDILEGDGVTQMERGFNDHEEAQEIEGPVVDLACDSVCVECEEHLSKGVVPPLALANGFWIGPIPEVLQGLSFAEKLLVARIRHNRCLVRVSSGRAKMTGNVIMFSNPILKVYKELPPSRAELEDVLAFIFTGPVQPTPDDFARTPMLVRRNKVADALAWLKINHRDYCDLVISEEHLRSYDLAGVPVVVDYKRTELDDGNKLPSELSVHDSENDEGTEIGPCPFTVHGLAALDHLMTEEKTLGIGHSAQPESMYDNPQAYPQMFPWLFSYGMGGFENENIVGRISEESHKRKLLLYHDKRFQTDVYFPIVAFNHAQMKSSSTSSFLVAKHAKFPDIADRLLGLNLPVLSSISERMIEGEIVKPVTQDENLCAMKFGH